MEIKLSNLLVSHILERERLFTDSVADSMSTTEWLERVARVNEAISVQICISYSRSFWVRGGLSDETR